MRNPAAAARPRKPSLFKKKETALAPAHRKPLKQRLVENWQLYLLLLIPVVITIVYKYGPMYGIQIAFRDFTASRGIWGSEWVGFEWFERFFSSPNCGRMIVNTVLISLYSLLWSFPVPIILALALNQLRFHKLKRVVQTVLYAPHFISTMIICGMLRIFLSPSGGLINLLLGTSIDFINQSSMFRTIYIASGIWQEAGWGTIIYCILSFFANRWSGYMALLGTLLDPFLRPFRRLLPPIKGFDLSPILFFLLLNLALRFLVPASMGLYVF